MTFILNIETATKNCSVSLSDNNKIIAIKELNDGQYSHAEKLHVFIEDILKETDKSVQDLDAIAVSKGPGSFTGLRIGVSAAKGFCYALDIPLIAVSTLASLAHTITVEKDAVIVPMLDARRMEVYSAVFDSAYHEIREIRAEVIDEHSFLEFLEKGKVYFLGDGAEKCKSMIQHKNAIFLEGYFPSSSQMPIIAYPKYKISDIENVAYFEPFYLKDFLITPSKK